MGCCNQNNHQPSTCCCSRRRNTPPSIDPILVQSVVSQILQNPQPTRHPFAAATAGCPFDLHSCSSQFPLHQNKRQPELKQYHARHQPFEDQFQTQSSVLSSLLQRIDVLESSLHRFSSPSSSSTNALTLRHVAARTIQIHFRAYLVRRSRALRELKELASIKSDLNALKSSVTLRESLDFFSISRVAMDLIRRLATIQGDDQMVRDSKSSIRKEIAQFLELVDGICVKRNQVSSKIVKRVKLVKNDGKSRVSHAGRQSSEVYVKGKSSKHSNLDSDEKKLINNLRERVGRIQEMSKALKEKDEQVEDGESSHDSDDAGSKRDQLQSPPAKRVGFLEDRNITWVFDVDEDQRESVTGISGNAGKGDDPVDNLVEVDEEESDSDENLAESDEGSEDEDEAPGGSHEESSQGSSVDEESPRNASNPRQNDKFVLSAPAPAKMEGRGDLRKKLNAVKISG